MRSAGPYDGWLKRAIHLTKYHGESARIDDLVELMVPALLTLPSVDALVPVPLHRRRVTERGFDQAALLAEALSKRSGVPLWQGLVRVRDTPHQVGLGAAERAVNLAGAIELRDPGLNGPSYPVLVDDVFTTGATIRECIAAASGMRPRHISALTLC
jgi:competence protein ComFC